MSELKKELSRYNPQFSRVAWIVRIITMSMALIAVIYYLNQFHKGKLTFSIDEEPKLGSSGQPMIEMKIPVRRAAD